MHKTLLTLFLCMFLAIACSTPNPSKCVSDRPGIILAEDNLTGQCVEININFVRVMLAQDSHTFVMTINPQGVEQHFRVVEDYDVMQDKIDRAYELLK